MYKKFLEILKANKESIDFGLYGINLNDLLVIVFFLIISQLRLSLI